MGNCCAARTPLRPSSAMLSSDEQVAFGITKMVEDDAASDVFEDVPQRAFQPGRGPRAARKDKRDPTESPSRPRRPGAVARLDESDRSASDEESNEGDAEAYGIDCDPSSPWAHVSLDHIAVMSTEQVNDLVDQSEEIIARISSRVAEGEETPETETSGDEEDGKGAVHGKTGESGGTFIRFAKSPTQWMLFLGTKCYGWEMYMAENGYNEVLHYADKITKINRYGKKQTRLFAITDKAIYNLKEVSSAAGVEVKRRVELVSVKRLSRSWKSRQFIVHVPSEYDYWYASEHRKDIFVLLKELVPNIRVIDSTERDLKHLVSFKNENVANTKAAESLKALPALERELKVTRCKDRRIMARNELVVSEQVFCREMSSFLETFAFPLDIWRNKNSIMRSREKWLNIFDNFENIARFHCKHFCPLLQGALKDKTDIGVAITKRLNLLRNVYTPYLLNWSRLQSDMKKLLSKTKYQKYFRKREDQNQGASVMSFFILPIQRIPRYVLLLNELLSLTDSFHPEHKSLQHALAEFQKLAVQCNDLTV